MTGKRLVLIILIVALAGTAGAMGVYYYQHYFQTYAPPRTQGGGKSGSVEPPNYEASAVVREVVDGDSIKVDILKVMDPHEGVKPGKDKVRFAGMDAEEKL